MNLITSQQISLSLIKITDYIKPFLPILESHMVNFFTHNLWEKNVPEGIKEEVEKCNLQVSEFFNDPKACTFDYRNELRSFIDKAQIHFPASLDVCLHEKEIEELLLNWDCVRKKKTTLDNSFMSYKKSHEVEVMSDVIECLSGGLGCSHILDVGGGKGYLGSVLALEHKLKVLSLDSSSMNTHVAGKRVLRMEKYWQGIRKRIETGYTRKGKHWKSKPSNSINNTSNIPEVQVTKDLNDNLNDLYKHATLFVNGDTDILSVVREKFPEEEDISLALVGLHTCGNLGPSSIELFLKSKSVRLLLNVGCCYHLLTDKFGDEMSDDPSCSSTTGFPMSELLCSKGFRLTYNTRVVAAQALDRIREEKQAPSPNLFYRALLEVFLVEKLKAEKIYKIGSIKCDSFHEYARKALEKFGLIEKVTDQELDDILEKYRDSLTKLQIYFMMRVTLAPIVEAICLLDRLQYLHEQGIKDAYLMQLFDPVKSPRCYGIIAVRN